MSRQEKREALFKWTMKTIRTALENFVETDEYKAMPKLIRLPEMNSGSLIVYNIMKSEQFPHVPRHVSEAATSCL
jgi:hypothetical protein